MQLNLIKEKVFIMRILTVHQIIWDTIIEEMKTDFCTTQEKIEVTNFWGHIHEIHEYHTT